VNVQVVQVLQAGPHLFLNRVLIERLPVMYVVVDVTHIFIANTPIPKQTASAFIEPVDARALTQRGSAARPATKEARLQRTRAAHA